ncbi:structural maintenance of chromosomes protein [Entamoeba marina]
MEVIETPDTSGSETSGTIEKIRLVNFMCHSHYELNLCPRVNFIVGENGSGKSAILVALAICFGAKAHFTNRGKKVSDIIKQGENYAEVTVCLKNTGSLRMDPSKYGDTIAIERRITKEGASYRVYALKANEKQRIVGRKASDVSAILDHFNIPIDNPCILLMQDTSKTFLTSTRAEDKYNFFLKATQLEKIKSNYKLAEDHLKRAKRNKEEKDPQKNQMQTHVDALEHRIKRVLDFNNVKEKLDKEIDLLKRELAASKVQDITKEKSHLLENQQTVEDSITQATPEHIETQINSTLQKIESIKKILSDAKFKSNALNNKKEARMSAVSTSKGSLNEIRVELRDQQETVERTKARQKLFEDTIEEIRNTDEDDTRHKLEEKRFKLEQNQMELDETKKKEESESEQLKSLESELASKSSIYAKQSDDLNSLKNRLRNSKKEKSHAEYTKRDSVSMYHRFIPKLLEEMKKVKFKSTPIGPIGEYIRLTDKKWCHVVENCVSRQILASFVCSDESDVQTIKNIGKRINYSVTTFCYPKQNPQKYQVNKQSHAMVCDILKIDSPYVF